MAVMNILIRMSFTPRWDRFPCALSNGQGRATLRRRQETRRTRRIRTGRSIICPRMLPRPALGDGRRGEDSADHVHPLDHPAERGEALLAAPRVHRRNGVGGDEELAHRAGAAFGLGHGDRAFAVAKAGAAGRLVRDRRQHSAVVAADAALDEAALRRAVRLRAAR